MEKSAMIFGAVVLVVIGVSAFMLMSSPKSTPNIIDGIECSSEQSAFHIHVHLDVFVDGQTYAVPSDTGITSTCLFWLHTHDPTGIIHIEAPYLATFKLGQYIDIWSKSAVTPTPPTGTPVAYVNGQKYSGSFKDIQLNAHDEIALVYGTPPAQIPSSYSFPAGT